VPEDRIRPDPEREGLELWEAGRLAEAEQKYREAFSLTVEGQWGRPHIRAGLASILAAQGKAVEALAEFETTLREELVLSGNNHSTPSVVVARYFLAEHLLHQGRPSDALAVLAPSLGSEGDFSLRLVEARACAASGDIRRASDVLQALLKRAISDEQRADLEIQIQALSTSGEPSAG
jgi:Flp pilus assembly protein TadD